MNMYFTIVSILLVFSIIGFIISEWNKYKNRMIKSAKVAWIMEQEFDMKAKDFREPYYFGVVGDKGLLLYKQVYNRLFDEGIDSTFIHAGKYEGLDAKSVKEWKKLGYINSVSVKDKHENLRRIDILKQIGKL